MPHCTDSNQQTVYCTLQRKWSVQQYLCANRGMSILLCVCPADQSQAVVEQVKMLFMCNRASKQCACAECIRQRSAMVVLFVLLHNACAVLGATNSVVLRCARSELLLSSLSVAWEVHCLNSLALLPPDNSNFRPCNTPYAYTIHLSPPP